MTSPLPVLPQIIVEAGFVPDSPTAPGGAMVLGTGLLGTATLGTSINWTDISPYVLAFTVTRPSTRLQGPLWNYQAATASITLDNSDGRFDPDNLAGPYVSGGVTQLAAMVPVRIRALFGPNGYPLFNGFADGWLPAQVSYEGGYAELTLPATDAFKVLAGITLAAVSVEGVGADTGARVRDILSRAGWYTTADRNVISTGNSLLQGTTLGDTALNLMQLAVDSEIGQLYVNGSGAVVFRARHDLLTDTRSNTPQAVFGDLPGTVQTAGTELACASITRASDDTTIGNDIQATRQGGTLQEVQNAASIAKYLFPRSYARSDLILQNDSDALNWAQWVAYVAAFGEDRFESLAVDPLADPYSLWPQVLGREIGDRIQVWNRPAGVASPITKDCFIAGITHAWDSVASSWLTTWTLQDASKYGSFLTLGNATLGQLGSNALAFLRGRRGIAGARGAVRPRIVQQAGRAASLAQVARHAEHLVAVRETLPDEPHIEPRASTDTATSEETGAVRLAVALDVVDAQVAGRAAAGACTAIVTEDLILQRAPSAPAVVNVFTLIDDPAGLADIAVAIAAGRVGRERGQRLPHAAFAALLAGIVVHVGPLS